MNNLKNKTLYAHIERMKKTGRVGTKEEWDSFLNELENALREKEQIDSELEKQQLGNSIVVFNDGGRIQVKEFCDDLEEKMKEARMRDVKSPFIEVTQVTSKGEFSWLTFVGNISRIKKVKNTK